MKKHIGKQDRGHTHRAMGNEGKRDGMAGKEFHAMNKKHGTDQGFHAPMDEGCASGECDMGENVSDEE
jgi:hypothetical protein